MDDAKRLRGPDAGCNPIPHHTSPLSHTLSRTHYLLPSSPLTSLRRHLNVYMSIIPFPVCLFPFHFAHLHTVSSVIHHSIPSLLAESLGRPGGPSHFDSQYAGDAVIGFLPGQTR